MSHIGIDLVHFPNRQLCLAVVDFCDSLEQMEFVLGTSRKGLA